jgi:hypothetical protein
MVAVNVNAAKVDLHQIIDIGERLNEVLELASPRTSREDAGLRCSLVVPSKSDEVVKMIGDVP